jgi:hypothetical protein
MANSYYTRVKTFLAATLARGSDVKSELDLIVSAFDSAELVDKRAIKLPASPAPSDQVITESAAARASKILGFDANGNIVLTAVATTLGVFQGVKDKDLTAPPGSESNLDTYIPAATATGAWAGKEGNLAVYDSGLAAYKFYVPSEGWSVHVNDEDTFYTYTGSAWVSGFRNINNTVIGAVTPLAGGFTTLTTSGVVTHSGGDVTIDKASGTTFCRIVSYGGSPVVQTRPAAGTKSSPTAITSGSILALFESAGYQGAAFGFRGRMIMSAATENFTASAQGRELQFYSVANGTILDQLMLTLKQDKSALFACAIVNTITTLANDATPSVSGGKIFLTGGTTTITDFDDGATGQEIIILAEHAITITDGTNIFLNGSANFVMASSDSLHLVQKANGFWYEVGRSVN